MNRLKYTLERKARFLSSTGLLLALTLSSEIAISQQKTVQEMVNQVELNIPISSIERAEKDGTAYHISLKDLTKLALQNNLDIAISDTNEQLYQDKIIQAHGPYDPAFSFTL
ncbi:MAG TPA: hypothetical protein VMG30_13215, partial [Acidobacteriota bacterium]|nr:hypothetical protein [Acidobacteriota bacterium]